MSNGADDQKRKEEEIAFEFKKLEFERVFGHISALDTRISIAVAVETLLIGLIVLIIVSVFEDKLPKFLVFNIPTLGLLFLCLLSGLIAMYFCLLILKKRIIFDFPDTNPRDHKSANSWIEGYVKRAVLEIKERHHKWELSLLFLVIAMILFAFTSLLIIINSETTSKPSPRHPPKYYYKHIR
jgi:hypothetical protein